MSSLQNANATHQKLSVLKRKLYQEGYRYSMDVESLPLIEKLYADLIHAKECLKKAQMENIPNEVTSTSTLISEQTDIYKEENLKLFKENSDLHNQLIQIQTTTENNLLEIKANMKKLERENAELKFLNSQYAHQMKILETESKEKTERILQLQDKNHTASVHIIGGSKKKLGPFRKQKMDIEYHLPPAVQPIVSPRPQKSPDQKTVDLLKMAEDNISRLKSEAVGLNSEIERLQNKLTSVMNHSQSKDKEVSNLARLIERGPPRDLNVLEAKDRNSQKTINHLNCQIDLLQKQVGDLEFKVGRRKIAWDDERFEGGDNDYDDGRKKLTNDSSTVKKYCQELMDKQGEINRLNADLVSKEREIRNNLTLESRHKHELDDLVIKLQQDKNTLMSKIERLTSNEKELVLEMDKLKHLKPKSNVVCRKVQCKSTKPMTTTTGTNKHPNIKTIEEERNYYKGEVDTLLRVLSTISLQRSQGCGSASPYNQRSDSPANKNYSCSNNGQSHRHGDAARWKKERDELRGLVESYSKHFQEIQSSIRTLTLERDNLNALYNQTREELNESRYSDFDKSYNPSSGTHPLLRKLEDEREEALVRVRSLREERDELFRQIEDMNDSILNEREKYEKSIADLRRALEDLESSKRRPALRPESYINDFDINARDQLRSTRDEVNQYKATATQMKLIADQAEETLKEKEAALISVQSELRTAWMRVEELERRLDREKSGAGEEMDKLRRMLERMDREKDDLQMEVDAKVEVEAELKESLRVKEKLLREIQAVTTESESVLSKMKNSLSSKDNELANLRHQMNSVSEDLKFTTRLKDGLVKENKKLQEEAENISKDAQRVTRDLHDTMRLKNKLSSQAQEYLNEVKRCQEILTLKEQERYDILEQYRLMNSDLEKVENQNNVLEVELSKLKIELLGKETEVKRLKETCQQTDKDIQDHVAIEQNYNVQLFGINKNVSMLEETVARLERNKQTLTYDLNMSRDLNSRMEQEKTQLERQLANVMVDVAKLEELIDNKRVEADALRIELATSKQRIIDLENHLQVSRTKEWQGHMEVKQKESENQLLKDRVTLNNNKIENQSKELSYNRSRVVELEGEVEKMKRQIISEKFERERLVQALKSNNITLPDSSRLGVISPESLSRRINSEKVTMSKSEFMKKYNIEKKIGGGDDDGHQDWTETSHL